MSKETVDRLARLIWDYHHLNHPRQKCDIILALGSNDLRVAEFAADLYLEGWAPLLVLSGNVGDLTRDRFHKPEAEMFSDIAIGKGVPPEAILLEPESRNTGENVQFTRRMLSEKGIDLSKIMLVQKPYMERRAYATFMKVWPGKEILLASPPIPYEEYPTTELPRDLVINIMLGDLQRIRLYPERGFQIEQEIPDEVWAAFEELVSLGYDKRLIQKV